MGLYQLTVHLLNFVAPALAVAACVVLAGLLVGSKAALLASRWAQLAVNLGVGVAVLVAGLAWWGRDGKMATYAALVLCCALSQWVLLRGWKR